MARRFLPVLLSLFLLAACAPSRLPVPPAVPVTSEMLLQNLQVQGTTYHSLRGVAKVRIESGEQTLTGTQLLLVRKPDLLRAETLSPFGNPLLIVAADGHMLSVMLPGEGRFLQGAASYENIRRFTRLPLQLRDLVLLLLWQVPIIPYDESRLTAAEDGDWCLLFAAAGQVRQELLFDRELRLMRSSYYQEETLVMQVDYERFEDAGIPFPRRLRLALPEEESAATLHFSDIEINPELTPERFSLAPPAGYTVEPLP